MQFSGILFDLDGTLIDSLAAVDRAWTAWAGRHGLSPDMVMEVIHGRPARESVAELLKDAHEMEVKGEVRWLEIYESEDTEGTIALPGSIELLNKLDEMGVPWAIVTSGTLPVATARIKAAGLPQPKVLITPEQVTNGKPDPEPFVLGAEKLGLKSEQCLVFEDAPAGVQAGSAAKATVIAMTTHFTPEELSQALHHIDSLEQVKITAQGDSFEFSLNA